MLPESRRKYGRTLSILIASLLPVFSASITVKGQPSAGDGPAGLVPSSAIMFLQTSSLSSAVPAARYFIENLLPAEDSKKIKDWNADFKAKTGVDMLDAASLAGAGVDAGRPAAMAYLDASKGSERIMILVPVKNEKTFPQRFVEVIKKANRDRPALDLHPAVIRQGNHLVYRMMDDIFFTGIKGYLVIASSKEIISSVIDLGSSSLAADPLFASYTAKKRAGNDLDIYLKKAFLEQIDGGRKGKKARQDGDETGEDEGDSRNGDSEGDEAPGGKTERTAPGGALSVMAPESNFFEFMAAGFVRTKEGISVDFSLSLTDGNPATALASGLFRPGIPEYTLSSSNPLAYHYVSLDIKALDAFCERNSRSAEYARACEYYAKLKKEAGAGLGLDLDADFLPWFGGYFNAVMRKARISGTLDNFVFFVPMTDGSKAANLAKKLRTAVREKNPEEGAFGDERIDALPSFWFKDKRGNRISVLAGARGVFIANNTEFLREVLAADSPKSRPAAGLFGDPPTGSFLLSYLRIEKESYMKALLMFLTYNAGPHIAGLVNRVDSISLTGTRAGNYYSFRMAFSLTEPEKASGAK